MLNHVVLIGRLIAINLEPDDDLYLTLEMDLDPYPKYKIYVELSRMPKDRLADLKEQADKALLIGIKGHIGPTGKIMANKISLLSEVRKPHDRC